MATPKEDPQSGMFDRTVEHPELAEAIEEFLDTHDEAKRNAAAKKKISGFVEALGLKDEERLRCNGYIITGRARAGGGFEVPTWEKVTVGGIVASSD